MFARPKRNVQKKRKFQKLAWLKRKTAKGKPSRRSLRAKPERSKNQKEKKNAHNKNRKRELLPSPVIKRGGEKKSKKTDSQTVHQLALNIIVAVSEANLRQIGRGAGKHDKTKNQKKKQDADKQIIRRRSGTNACNIKKLLH